MYCSIQEDVQQLDSITIICVRRQVQSESSSYYKKPSSVQYHGIIGAGKLRPAQEKALLKT